MNESINNVTFWCCQALLMNFVLFAERHLVASSVNEMKGFGFDLYVAFL